MARERLHRKLLVSYVALIGVFLLVALWLAPARAEHLRGVLTGALIALGVAVALAAIAARSVGGTLAGLTRSVRLLAAGQPLRADDLRRGPGTDEIDDLTVALGELSRRLVEERHAFAAEAEKLRAVLDGMSEGVALLSGGRIGFANPAFTRLLGLAGKVEGLTPLEAVRRHDLAAPLAAAGRGAIPDPLDIAAPSGRVLQLRAAPLAPGAALVVLLDVTEARSLERMRREFVANASHELRTPVAAIQAVAETLAAAPEMSPADRARFERILLHHAERLGRLVADLLDLSRAEASRAAVGPVDLARPLAAAVAAVRERAEARRLRLADELPADLPALAANETTVEQVLVNLLDNAVKYTPEGGRIVVRASVVAEGGGPLVRIEVEDTGIGIPAEHLPRLFERFYRVDPARSRELGGTGLGLAIVKHLVQSHGGTVGVRSRVGVGSIFSVTFPVHSSPPDPAASAPPVARRGAGG